MIGADATDTLRLPGDLFRGQHTVRFRGERTWFWICLLTAPLTAGAIGVLLHSPFQANEIAIIVAAAVVYVTLARGRLLGTSALAHERQFPELFDVIDRCARRLGMRTPQVFVRDDLLVPVTAVGLAEPYSVIVSSSWLRHIDEQELEFLIGCELGHIAAGHTRISSLFSASGRENPLIALVFGAWLRRTEYTADRVGLLCCRSMEAALRAIYALSFREHKGQVQHEAFIEQREAIQRDPSLAMGEWLGETPYAVNRIMELRRFATAAPYAFWSQRLEEEGIPRESASLTSRPAAPTLYIRSLALAVDAIVAGAISASGALVVHVTVSRGDLDTAVAALKGDPSSADLGRWLAAHAALVGPDVVPAAGAIVLLLYSLTMVALIGRTCGMMVFDLRVVRAGGKPVGTLRALWRYALAVFSILTVIPVAVGAFTGRWLHERLSGTQLVRGGVS